MDSKSPVFSTVHRATSALVLGLGVIFLAACGGSETMVEGLTVYEGARLIVGDGSAAIEDAVFVVQDDRFTAVGARGDVDVPAGADRIDLSGKTVMPAIVNAHFHLVPDREARIEQLRHMAYYGTGTVISLGMDDQAGLDMRAESISDAARSLSAGRGITRPEPGRSEVPHWIDTPDEARAAVQDLAADNVDFVKIWVDDRSGQYEKLTPELYGAVIDEAHAHDLMVTAHIFNLSDAKGLLEAGIDAFAHGIRDMDADDEVVDMWLERPDVYLVPNLPGPGVAEDLSWLSGTVPAARLAEMQAAQQDRPAAQASFGIQARNLARLSEAGVQISFGTDGGSPWAVHQEMADMVRSGMSPADVLNAATGTAAAMLDQPDVGHVASGKSADFVVLNANPLENITNTRDINAVYLRGTAVDRDGIAATLLGSGQ